MYGRGTTVNCAVLDIYFIVAERLDLTCYLYKEMVIV